jgi:Na+-transporting NADH:ubiquinone oxidoreductase subunit A
MSQTVSIRKGLDIRLVGEAAKQLREVAPSSTVCLSPLDFHGLNPKVVVKEGESVKIGDVIMYDKGNEQIKFCSPVAGTVRSIIRGEKRRILQVLIDNNGQKDFKVGSPVNVESLNAEQLLEVMLSAGLWPFVKQRPLDVVADPTKKPKAVFVSTFDSAPLGPDYEFGLAGREEDLQSGINAFAKLSGGKVHLGVQPNSKLFGGLKNAQINKFSGKHPVGNVGVQIHHIDPVNKGEFVWTVNVQDLAIIGHYLNTGKFVAERNIALTGSEINAPQYAKVTIGCSMNDIVNGQLKRTSDVRLISGNVLTGDKKEADDYFGFYHNQVTVIPEGNQYKFFLTTGWLGLGFDKFSNSRLFPTFLMPSSKKFVLDTNTNGEERAFVVTGELDRVFPFDILPMQLIKAAITNDIDGMENLGIYEVAPEDFALCEYVCTTKINIQDKIREGLDLIGRECM